MIRFPLQGASKIIKSNFFFVLNSCPVVLKILMFSKLCFWILLMSFCNLLTSGSRANISKSNFFSLSLSAICVVLLPGLAAISKTEIFLLLNFENSIKLAGICDAIS